MHCKDHAEANVNLEVVRRRYSQRAHATAYNSKLVKTALNSAYNRGNVTWMLFALSYRKCKTHMFVKIMILGMHVGS